MGIIPRTGMGMGRKSPLWHFAGTGTGKFLPHEDGDGEALPDGEFPIDISSPKYIEYMKWPR